MRTSVSSVSLWEERGATAQAASAAGEGAAVALMIRDYLGTL